MSDQKLQLHNKLIKSKDQEVVNFALLQVH